MKIRKGRTEDIKFIKKMDDVSLKASHSLYYFLDNLENILVAVEQGKIIGYILSKGEELTNIAVHSDFQRKGIGRRLIKEVMKRSKILISRTRENNKNALSFLKKLGFKHKRKIKKYYSNGDNAIEMEWRRS